MENAGSGMIRRILPITTKSQTLPSDLLKGLRAEKLDQALQAEIGQLISWAMQMPRPEVEAVLRGEDPEGLLKSNRMDCEVNMDATRAFIDQCLTSGESTTIPNCSELFLAYQLFCKAKGFKGVCNETTFKSRLRGALAEFVRPRMGVPGNANAAKVPAMFFGFDLIEGLWDKDPYSRYSIGLSHETEKGPIGANWGVLHKTKLSEGGFAEIRGRALGIPTHEELKQAEIV
jgi:phage/plasmid-associated DNA primase